MGDVVLRHPNRSSIPVLEVTDAPSLFLGINNTTCSLNPSKILSLTISVVHLTFFPGIDLARKYVSCAWAGYLQHEALELCTINGLEERPLDPHKEPYTYDRGVRQGLPHVLTPESMQKAFEIIMSKEDAQCLCKPLFP